MPWGTVAVQKGKECHSLIEDIEIPAADSALGARFQKCLQSDKNKNSAKKHTLFSLNNLDHKIK